MGVGEQQVVNIADAAGHGLGAEIGAAVDEQAGIVVFQVDAGPGALVSRVGGIADGTSASKGGHAGAGAGT